MKKKRKSDLIAVFALAIPFLGFVVGTGASIGLAASGSENVFTGIGFYSVILGIILFIVTIVVDDKEIDRINKEIKAKNKGITSKLLRRVNKFKSDYGYDKSNVVDINDEYFWVHGDYFLSIYKDSWFKENLEMAHGYYHNLTENEGDFKINTIKSVSDLPLLEIRIKIEDIDYYLVKGSLNTEQVVTGGGSSLTGAVVGGIVAGGVGAIIGSRKKIKTKSIVKDNREIVLVYRQSKKVIKKIFPFQQYNEMFELLLPEKEHTYVTIQKSKSK